MFPEVFSGGFGRWKKISAKFKLKANIQSLKKKRNVSFASLNQFDEELNSLEQIGVQSKVGYNEWASPTVYV